MQLTVIDLADLNDLDRAALRPPLGGAGVEQVVILVGDALNVLPPSDSDAM